MSVSGDNESPFSRGFHCEVHLMEFEGTWDSLQVSEALLQRLWIHSQTYHITWINQAPGKRLEWTGVIRNKSNSLTTEYTVSWKAVSSQEMIPNALSANEQLENWGHSHVSSRRWDTQRGKLSVRPDTHLPEEGAVTTGGQWVSLKMDNTRSSCRWRFGLVSCAVFSSCHNFPQATSLASWFCAHLWILSVRNIYRKDIQYSLVDRRQISFQMPLCPIPMNDQSFRPCSLM